MSDDIRQIMISLGGVSWDHLRYTSPGSLKDHELHEWGYEPSWAGPEFVKECRQAVLNPVQILRIGNDHEVLLLFPTPLHARSVLYKLESVGRLRIMRTFDAATREEARCFLAGAARGFEQLRKQWV